MNLVAIDPGSNKCGIATFRFGVLSSTETLLSNEKTPLERRLDMAYQLEELIKTADRVISEEPLLLGRNNNGMQRLLGYIEFLASESFIPLQFVHPMTLKKFMGAGSSDKLDMALAAGEMLKTSFEQELLAGAITREAWDETDAVCVGLYHLAKVNNDTGTIKTST